jgi:hypothetical protein
MDFDNVPALSCSWSDNDQELYERALNIAPEVDRPKTSKGRPRIPHLRKVLTERGQAFRTSDNVETLWRLCAESHAKAAADAKAAASQYAQSGIDVNEAAAGGRSSEPAAVKKTNGNAKPKATYEASGERWIHLAHGVRLVHTIFEFLEEFLARGRSLDRNEIDMKASNNVWQKIADKFHDPSYEPDMLNEVALAADKSGGIPPTEKKKAIAVFLDKASPAHRSEMCRYEPDVLRKKYKEISKHLQEAINWCVPSPGP